MGEKIETSPVIKSETCPNTLISFHFILSNQNAIHASPFQEEAQPSSSV
jgi:hypothetical protein